MFLGCAGSSSTCVYARVWGGVGERRIEGCSLGSGPSDPHSSQHIHPRGRRWGMNTLPATDWVLVFPWPSGSETCSLPGEGVSQTVMPFAAGSHHGLNSTAGSWVAAHREINSLWAKQVSPCFINPPVYPQEQQASKPQGDPWTHQRVGDQPALSSSPAGGELRGIVTLPLCLHDHFSFTEKWIFFTVSLSGTMANCLKVPWAVITPCFLFLFYCCPGWGYIVAFTKVLAIYQIYPTWIHPLHHSPSFPSFLELFQQMSFFPFTYMCTQYLLHIYPPSPFPYLFLLLFSRLQSNSVLNNKPSLKTASCYSSQGPESYRISFNIERRLPYQSSHCFTKSLRWV
jgi:hypothetical protein